MRPDTPLTPDPTPARRDTAPLQPRMQEDTTSDSQQAAAANITRQQIHQIYEQDSPYKHVEGQAEPSSPNAYEQSPYNDPTRPISTTEHFRKYHSAWQDYYQKYYEGYYLRAVRETQAKLESRHALEHSAGQTAIYSSASEQTDAAMTPHTAVKELRSSLRHKISERATTVRKSRHFWPLITAVSVALVFAFLQYNRLLIANVAAYVSPGSIEPQNIILDPTTDTQVGPDPELIIPKINVEAPVIYGINTLDDNVIQDNLRNGVVHYPIPGADSVPGQAGNTVIIGHSSNDVFDNGNYKFVFLQLNKMTNGDTFYLNYQSIRYTYHVTNIQVIEPNEVSKLVLNTTKPMATLVTCTPAGTALHRLVVTGEQVSPDPSTASSAPTHSTGSQPATISGNSPTLLQRIFGG